MEVALGAAGLVEELAAAGVAGFGETVRLTVAEVFAGVAFSSGVAAKLDSVVVGGVETSGLGAAFGCGCSGFVIVGVCLAAGDARRNDCWVHCWDSCNLWLSCRWSSASGWLVLVSGGSKRWEILSLNATVSRRDC